MLLQSVVTYIVCIVFAVYAFFSNTSKIIIIVMIFCDYSCCSPFLWELRLHAGNNYRIV